MRYLLKHFFTHLLIVILYGIGIYIISFPISMPLTMYSICKSNECKTAAGYLFAGMCVSSMFFIIIDLAKKGSNGKSS